MARLPIRMLLLSAAGALALALAAPVVTAQAPKEPATVILKGAPLGGVKFDHASHAKTNKVACTTCHHAAMKEKPAKAANQKCSDCHTKVAAAPMKTNYRSAFHDATAKTGLCVTCHQKENAAGKKAPIKCNECHKKENV
jgi:hypothetical protein